MRFQPVKIIKLRSSQLTSKLNLHDSPVDTLKLIHNRKEAVLHVELCNWRQTSYKSNDPEMVVGLFVFTDVEKVALNFTLFREDEIKLDGQILAAEALQESGDDSIEFYIYVDGQYDVISLVIHASEVSWQPHL